MITYFKIPRDVCLTKWLVESKSSGMEEEEVES
jgi:hypothetical protein